MATTYQWDTSQFGAENPDSLGYNEGRFKADIEAEAGITKAIESLGTSGTTVTLTFKEDLPADQEAILEGADPDPPPYGGLVGNHSGEAVQPPPNVVQLQTKQADETPLVALAGRVSRSFNFATHNYCDPCTWYGESARKTAQPLVQVGDRWVLPDELIIDMRGGRVSDEEGWIAEQAEFEPGNPHGYALKVYADGVEQTQAPGFGDMNGDYYVDYAKGLVYTINGTDWTGQTVTADYSQSQTSGWFIRPTEGRVLEVHSSEVQFSNPFEYTSAIIFEGFGLVDYFAPQLMTTNGGPIPPGTSIPLERTTWKTLDQVNDEAKGSLPDIPPMGGPTRGTLLPRRLLQFIYPGSRRIFHSLGMYVRIYLEGDVPFRGERATATFYGVSLKDPGAAEAIKEFA